MNIKLNKINFFYDNKQCLFNISLKCDKSKKLVLLGPSGSGKSTLLKVFNLLNIPKNGTLSIINYYFKFYKLIPNKKQLIELRKNVGMIFQKYNLWPHLTVLENLVIAPCKVLKINKYKANLNAKKILYQLKLNEFINEYPPKLSTGQQQRVAIARALMMKPSVMLFDEPTSSLDYKITEEIINIINELSRKNVTQIIVTHELDFAYKIADEIIYMENGRIIGNKIINNF